MPVGDAKLVNEILYNKEQKFNKHKALGDILRPLLGDSIFTTNGDVWRQQRTMMDQAFNHTSISTSFTTMLSAADDLIARLKQKQLANANIVIDDEMTHVTADIIFRTILSKPISSREAQQIYEAFSEYQRIAQKKSLLSFYLMPSFQYNKTLKKQAEQIRLILKSHIEERYHQKAENRNNDILDAMLQAKNQDTGKHFSLEELLSQICMVFLAGHETSASALTWALYLIASSEYWQEKLRDEVGEEEITPQRLKSFPNLKNVFFETLRLYPPVAFFMRQAKCPITRRSKDISEKDLLLISPWLSQRSQNHWQNPHEFMPERFDLHDNQGTSKMPSA